MYLDKLRQYLLQLTNVMEDFWIEREALKLSIIQQLGVSDDSIEEAPRENRTEAAFAQFVFLNQSRSRRVAEGAYRRR
jgi:hypothetical protein